jgi:predicted nucleotide-binding protein (sugar kinase/HSP70/actin superfamily)
MSLNGCKYEWKKILENLAVVVVISQHSSQSVYSVPPFNIYDRGATDACHMQCMSYGSLSIHALPDFYL